MQVGKLEKELCGGFKKSLKEKGESETAGEQTERQSPEAGVSRINSAHLHL